MFVCGGMTVRVSFLVADGWFVQELDLLSSLPQRTVSFHSLLCVPSLPSISPPVLSQESFLRLCTPSFCLFFLHVIPCPSPRWTPPSPVLPTRYTFLQLLTSFLIRHFSVQLGVICELEYSTLNTIFQVVNEHREESRSEDRSLLNTIWNVCPIRISSIDHQSVLSPLEPLTHSSLYSTFHSHSCHIADQPVTRDLIKGLGEIQISNVTFFPSSYYEQD